VPIQRTRTSYDRSEARRDRRYPLPTLIVVIDGKEHPSVNWSLGGFMLVGYEAELTVGAVLTGEFRFDDSHSVPFTADVMRVGPAEGEVGARFRELADPAFSLLERGIRRKLFGPRGVG
jgi:PilZ domain-containing protein